MKIYYSKIAEITESDAAILFRLLPDTRVTEIKRYRMTPDVYRSLTGDILARYALCIEKGLDFASESRKLEFKKNPHGKPCHTDFHFNVSHSGDFVLCAAGKHELGVDVEKIGKYLPGVAKKMFNDTEFAQVDGSINQAQAFYELWTEKESIIKADGRGFSYPDIKNVRLDGFIVTKLFIHEDYTAAVCSKAEDLPVEMIYLNLCIHLRQILSDLSASCDKTGVE